MSPLFKTAIKKETSSNSEEGVTSSESEEEETSNESEEEETSNESEEEESSSESGEEETSRKKDVQNKRRKQQEEIDKLVSYIDERSAHYNRNKLILTLQPYPKVDWSKVNSYTKKNLPKAECFPILGCPHHPDYYPDAPNPEGRIAICRGTKDCRLPGCSHETPIRDRPFGSLPGFLTNLGIVAMPSKPVGGYIYTEEEGWVLYATPG